MAWRIAVDIGGTFTDVVLVGEESGYPAARSAAGGGFLIVSMVTLFVSFTLRETAATGSCRS